jgi:hypothetical protein
LNCILQTNKNHLRIFNRVINTLKLDWKLIVIIVIIIKIIERFFGKYLIEKSWNVKREDSENS